MINRKLQSEDDKFYELMYRLKYIIRYSNIPRHNDESVAEHSFFVCVILINLHTRYDFDLGWALQMAVCHDIPEVYTNDLSWETKERFPELRKMLHKIEMELSSEFPAPIKEGIKDFLGDSVEAIVVRLADAIQCRQYTREEIGLGGSDYMYNAYLGVNRRIKVLEKELKPYERQS